MLLFAMHAFLGLNLFRLSPIQFTPLDADVAQLDHVVSGGVNWL